MPPITPRYERDEIVAIVGDFYTFLARFYIPNSAVKYPPPQGWPNITAESMSRSEKSPFVIDLLKHLPYIDEAHAHEEVTNIHFKSDVIDYSTYTPEKLTAEFFSNRGELGLRDWLEEKEEDEPESDDDGSENQSDDEEDSEEWNSWDWDEGPRKSDIPNFVALSQGYESGGRDIVLDVFKGVVYEDMIRCTQGDGVDISMYFTSLQEKFEKLELVLSPGKMFEKSFCGETEELTKVEDIYRKFGWPGESYRKEEALAEIRNCRRCQLIFSTKTCETQ